MPPMTALSPEGPPLTLIEAAADDAATDLGRTDSTNATLATLAGMILTILVAAVGLTTGDGAYPGPALAAVSAAAVCLAAVLWPRRGGRGGVPRYATLTPGQLATDLADTDPALWHAERAVAKAAIATRRHIAQRTAVVLLATAGLLLAAATVVTLALY